MILQALCGYYRRAQNSEGFQVAQPGYSTEGVSAVIVLDMDGNVVEAHPLSEKSGKKDVPMRMTVPIPPKSSGSKPAPSFLYVKIGALFGIGEFKQEGGAQYRFDASRAIHETVLSGCEDDGANAILRFMAKRKLGVTAYEGVDTEALQNPAGFAVFQLSGDKTGGFLHERPAIRDAWERYRSAQSDSAVKAQCLVTGEIGPIMRIHGNVRGFGTDKPTLVGFNQASFCSFGRYGEQGANAPVSEKAAFEYVTALNMLCADTRHCVTLADTRLLFWAERDASDEESLAGMLFGVKEENDRLDAAQRDRIHAVLDSVLAGGNPLDQRLDPKVRFYLLGLSANKTRLVVRYFYTSAFGDLLKHLVEHYQGLTVEGMLYRYPAPILLLLETAVEHKFDNVPPTLEPALMSSVINGTPYPETLYQAILRRVRAEKKLSALRAGIIKAYLNRKLQREAITVALNEEEKDRAYLLGRLFALFEMAQKRAIGDVNASIADKYLNSALATPQMVFPMLLALNQKHISKTEDYWLKMKVAAILDMLDLGEDANGKFAFPQSLNANDQGKFLLGYYHQTQALYRGKTVKNDQTDEADQPEEDETVSG